MNNNQDNNIESPFMDMVNANARRVRMEEYERNKRIQINRRRLERERKMKLQKIKRGVATVVVGATLLAGIVGYHQATKFEPVIPEGYHQIFTVEQVDYNESLWDIAEYYYDKDVYGQYYEDIRDFIVAIKEANGLHSNTLTPYQNLIIPCFVDNNNIYVSQIAKLEEQIRALPRYVDYEVQFGDTLLGLAYLGAGDTNEAYEIKEEIQRLNNLGTSTIVQGRTIQIVNPEIGRLKKEIAQYKDKLNESLRVNVESNELVR